MSEFEWWIDWKNWRYVTQKRCALGKPDHVDHLRSLNDGDGVVSVLEICVTDGDLYPY